MWASRCAASSSDEFVRWGQTRETAHCGRRWGSPAESRFAFLARTRTGVSFAKPGKFFGHTAVLPLHRYHILVSSPPGAVGERPRPQGFFFFFKEKAIVSVTPRGTATKQIQRTEMRLESTPYRPSSKSSRRPTQNILRCWCSRVLEPLSWTCSLSSVTAQSECRLGQKNPKKQLCKLTPSSFPTPTKLAVLANYSNPNYSTSRTTATPRASGVL